MHSLDIHLLAKLLSEQVTGLEWASFSTDDWSWIVDFSEAEGVGPQLYWALSRSGRISILPRACQDRLRAMYAATRLYNTQILRELELLAVLLDQARIPMVALKGICFALTIYPDIGLRPMSDLDLLVPHSRLPEAKKIALDSGYQETLPEAFPGINDALNNASSLSKIRAPYVTLELHGSLAGLESHDQPEPDDWFWTQTEKLHGNSNQFNLGNLLVLTPTAQLLYSCVHAMLQHGGRNVSLRWIFDLDQLIRDHEQGLNWELLFNQACKFDWGTAVSAALAQTVALFHTPVPQPILNNFARHTDKNAVRVREMQSLPGTHTLEEFEKFKSLDRKGRIKLFLGLVAPGPDYMRWRYGLKKNWVLPFWYLYRWWGIVKDGGKTVLHLSQKLYRGPMFLPGSNRNDAGVSFQKGK
jgi:hypothetical protein